MRPLPPPLLDPEVKYIVKIKISQKRTNTSPLNCPHLTLHPLPILQHTRPALCPECVTFKQVPLGQPPSLHPLRSLSQGLVQRLPRYYEAVRLPAPVYHRRVSPDFPMQSGNSTDRDRISRFPLKVFPNMPGVSDHAGLNACRIIDAPNIAFRHPDGVGIPENRPLAMNLISWLNTQPMRTPVNASLSPLRVATHDSSQCGSLLLHCMALSSTTPCQFLRRTWIKVFIQVIYET